MVETSVIYDNILSVEMIGIYFKGTPNSFKRCSVKISKILIKSS